MLELTKDQKSSRYNAILVGVPTFGMNSINFTESMKKERVPIWTSDILLPIIGKPVDVARNEIAAVAIRDNCGYVLFRDDDVNVQPDAAVKLSGRLTPKERGNPSNVGESIVGGVVYEKKQPPTPMIFKHDVPGGFEDWEYGDLVECDSIGMGCTLIPVGVFKKILDAGHDEFQCVNDYCAVNWTVSHKKGVDRCPTCGGPLAPVFFKTVISSHGIESDDGDPAIDMTEDTYFCILAKKHGVRVFADTGVQCEHEDTNTGTIYYYNKSIGCPVWQSEGRVDLWPRIDVVDKVTEKKAEKNKSTKLKKVMFDVGAGGFKRKGYIGIDLYGESDFKCDVRDLRPAISKFGYADDIVASHVLEHINHPAITATVRNWIKALKPGGHLYIEVPDARAAMERLLEHDSNGSSAHDYQIQEWVLYGEQTNDGMFHRTAITENKIKRILKSCSGMIDRCEVKVKKGLKFPNGLIYDAIMVDVWKKKAKKVSKGGRNKLSD